MSPSRPASRDCPACQTETLPGAKYCHACGSALGDAAPVKKRRPRKSRKESVECSPPVPGGQPDVTQTLPAEKPLLPSTPALAPAPPLPPPSCSSSSSPLASIALPANSPQTLVATAANTADAANAMDATTTASPSPLADWQQVFINTLTAAPGISTACLAAGVSLTTAQQAREESPAFREQWDEAVQRHTDKVEESLYSIATEGHEKVHVTKDGREVIQRVKDVQAMKFWLSGNRPAVYRDKKQVDITHGVTAELGEVLRAVRMRRQSLPTVARELPAEIVEVGGRSEK